MQQIGIGITTRNRRETAEKTIAEIRKHAPKGAKIVVVDDASDEPLTNSDFRFNKQSGIAVAKNKCLELLHGCEHIFLFDDDCYPKVKDWYKPYVESKYNHLMYIFGNFSNGKPNGNRKEKEIEDAVIFENPCGCMIYYKNICLDTVGGMDPAYGIWGFEHPDQSVRIHNAGLTPFKFMDVKNSDDLFFSLDKEQTVERSVPSKTRLLHIAKNKRKYETLGKAKHFIPYLPQKNLILTCYFTSLIDPQRGVKWEYDKNALDALRLSVPECIEFAVISDNEYQSNVTTPKHDNPYLAKWIAFRDYLTTHDVDNVFCVDGTDVEVLVNPFPNVKDGLIYVGDELAITNNTWLKNHHNVPMLNGLLRLGRLPLLNAGIIGGRKEIVLEFLNAMCDGIEQNVGLTDMLKFNYTLWSKFKSRIVHGRKVNTVFKSFDKFNREGSWFRHK